VRLILSANVPVIAVRAAKRIQPAERFADAPGAFCVRDKRIAGTLRLSLAVVVCSLSSVLRKPSPSSSLAFVCSALASCQRKLGINIAKTLPEFYFGQLQLCVQ